MKSNKLLFLKFGYLLKITLIIFLIILTIGVFVVKAQLCGIPTMCEYDLDCEFMGSICTSEILFYQWNPPPCVGQGTDTPDPDQQQCATLKAWIPGWNTCIFPVGGCGGIRSWPDPACD